MKMTIHASKFLVLFIKEEVFIPLKAHYKVFKN